MTLLTQAALGDHRVADPPGPGLLARVGPARWRPVPVAVVVALVLHVLWWRFLADGGGDIAAQDAWAAFIHAHPDTAVNFSWYGGIHVVSYSIFSPYLMALLGVRPTMVLAGTVSAGLVALLIERSGAVRRPMWPSVYAAVALVGNAVSGRVTFGVGCMLGLGALACAFAWPPGLLARRGGRFGVGPRAERWVRAAATAVLAALATTGSPVAGLFLGLIAAGLWLGRRRAAALALGLPPVLIVVASAVFFPGAGQQPMSWNSAILPVVAGISAAWLAPREWRVVRLTGLVYVVAVLASWLIPSPIGTNVTRLGLLYGGIVLVAIVANRGWDRSTVARRLGRWAAVGLLGASLITSTTWQVSVAAQNAVDTKPPLSWNTTLKPLVTELHGERAGLARVEVVPTASHRESTALAPYVNLARGWNRQADVALNPLFYRPRLGPQAYLDWLHRWAVRFVVVSDGTPDPAGLLETKLIDQGLPYLHQVWADKDWTVYAVDSPTPLVSRPAHVVHFGAAEITVRTPRAGRVVVRVPDSPWLSLVDRQGTPIPGPSADGSTPDLGCLSDVQTVRGVERRHNDWLVLEVPAAGTYRIAAPYKLPRGTPCLTD